ncbi:hypothetical protein F5Y16DRAFT_223819 [Xylariaceae sp. FL0255]|nr:hypothetical protein F5Y16DRAFT_223819 [Xylariaceae sp. FL0255]
MCIYILNVSLCGHQSQSLLTGPSCPRVAQEFARIYSPEAWATPEARASLPFDWPDSCSPSDANIRVMNTGKWCGWECRNTHDAAGLRECTKDGGTDIERQGSWGMGVPGAKYGVERKGIGWRD